MNLTQLIGILLLGTCVAGVLAMLEHPEWGRKKPAWHQPHHVRIVSPPYDWERDETHAA